MVFSVSVLGHYISFKWLRRPVRGGECLLFAWLASCTPASLHSIPGCLRSHLFRCGHGPSRPLEYLGHSQRIKTFYSAPLSSIRFLSIHWHPSWAFLLGQPELSHGSCALSTQSHSCACAETTPFAFLFPFSQAPNLLVFQGQVWRLTSPCGLLRLHSWKEPCLLWVSFQLYQHFIL